MKCHVQLDPIDVAIPLISLSSIMAEESLASEALLLSMILALEMSFTAPCTLSMDIMSE